MKDHDVIVDPTTASPVLEKLVEVLTTLIRANEHPDPKPTLILNGDVLELALASDNVALMVFELFLDRVFRPGEELFDATILYQPGNHDHHLWESARERQYGDLLHSLKPDEELPIPWHGTSLYYQLDGRPVYSELLGQLARRHHLDQGINFRVSYPNMGLRSEDGRTVVVFHHGHFVESIYELMSTLKDLVFPGRAEPLEVWDLEAENFAWIDFFWSTLGRSGDVGEKVGLVYDMLQSQSAIQKLAGNVALGLTDKLSAKGSARWFRWLIRPVLTAVFKRVATKVASSERKTPIAPLSPGADQGLSEYLAGPLIRQFRTEYPDDPLPDQVKFVFGHTHKPFVGTRDLPGSQLANPVRIFNSGGWVVDTQQPEPLHGANVVLIDESLEVACIRLYNQARPGDHSQVRLDDDLRVEQGPFYQRLSSLVHPKAEPWAGFSDAVDTLVAERHRALKTIIDNAGKPRPSGGPPPPTPPPLAAPAPATLPAEPPEPPEPQFATPPTPPEPPADGPTADGPG